MANEVVTRKINHLLSLTDQNGDGILEDADFALWIGRLAAIRGWEPGSDGYAGLEQDFYLAFLGMKSAFGDESGLSVAAATDAVAALAAADAPELGTWADSFFRLLDANGDGEIGPGEYRDLMASVSIDPTVADDAFARLDLNGDGHISSDEFARLYREFFTSDDLDAPGSWFWGPIPTAV